MAGGIPKPVERNSGGVPTTRQDVARQTSGVGAKAADVLNGFPLLPGKIVTGQVFVAGTNKVVIHGLGRVPKGWIAIRRYAFISWPMGEVEAAAADENTLTLLTNGSYTADIYVFG